MTNDKKKPSYKEKRESERKRKQQTRIERNRKRDAKQPNKFRDIVNNAEPADEDHQYLKDNNIPAYGLKQDGDRLIVPTENDGVYVGVQYIDEIGNKWFEPGSKVSGGYHVIKGKSNAPVIIAEGYSTAAAIHLATGLTVVVAFAAFNLMHVAKAVKKKFPKRKMGIAADDDQWTSGNPGLTKGTNAAKVTNAYLLVPDFKDTSSKPTDFNDLYALEGKDEVKKQIKLDFSGKPLSTSDKPKDIFSDLSEISKKPKLTEWLIKNHLEANCVGLVFGPPGCGKSFLILDIGFCIATGIDWNGNKTKQGGVVLIAGEGHAGHSRRAKALAKHYGVELINFIVSNFPASLIDEESVKSFWESIKAKCPNVKLIIIDTLHRNFGGGDENSSGDFSKVMNNIDNYFRSTGATILIVHHSGHSNQDRGRGTSSIKAAMDVEYKVSKNGNTVTVECTKAKEFTEPEPIAFTLQQQSLGYVDEEGEEVNSAILIPSEYIEDTDEVKLTENEQVSLDSLQKAIVEKGESIQMDLLENNEANDDTAAVNLNDWRELALPLIKVKSNDPKKKKLAVNRAFNRAKDKLIEKGMIAETDGYFCLVENTDLAV